MSYKRKNAYGSTARWRLALAAQSHLKDAVRLASEADLPLTTRRLKSCLKSMQGAVNNRERFARGEA
jgi:hypothetical protein